MNKVTNTALAEKTINRTFINAPLEVVWSILVATDRPLPFFFGSICQTTNGLKEGQNMRMVHPNGKMAMVVGEVLKFEPPHTYSHTFKMTDIPDESCIVTYRLSKKDDGTEFDLIIENVISGSKLEKKMLGAQSFISSNLKSLAETGKPAFSGKMVGILSPIFGLLGKKGQNIENWPLH